MLSNKLSTDPRLLSPHLIKDFGCRCAFKGRFFVHVAGFSSSLRFYRTDSQLARIHTHTHTYEYKRTQRRRRTTTGHDDVCAGTEPALSVTLSLHVTHDSSSIVRPKSRRGCRITDEDFKRGENPSRGFPL